MSSAVLYLAIVAVWGVVLVPMWLRRDTETPGITRLLHKRPDAEETEDEAPEAPEPEELPEPRPRRRTTRATVIARRRRRTTGLTALVLTAVGVVTSGLAPWWATVPPVVLLAGHLALLRVAVGMDTAHRRAAAAHARAMAREARRAAEATAPAEIIELPAPEEVFDQYADDRRAVGE
ncbi:MAG: divisome protein SepX/GlpR [Spirillospora sp.]